MVSDSPYVRLNVKYFGVYRVTGAELERAGVSLQTMRPADIGLFNEGRAVPVNVVCKNGNSFGSDDYLEFVGTPPVDSTYHYKAWNLDNIYLLRWDGKGALHYAAATLEPQDGAKITVLATRHIERDEQALRFVPELGTRIDGFFWFYASADTPAGHESPLYIDMDGLDRESTEPVKVTVNVVGLTNVASLKPQHNFDVLLVNDHETTLGQLQFDGIGLYSFETSAPASEFSGKDSVVLRAPAGRSDAVDSLGIDSVQVSYPCKLTAERRTLCDLSGRLTTGTNRLAIVSDVLSGTRVFAPATASVYTADALAPTQITLPVTDQQTSLVAVSPNGCYPVSEIVLQHAPSPLLNRPPADVEVLLYYHPKLTAAAKYYQEYRKNEGLKVLAVDVTTLYDQLNNGFISDMVIKRHARYVADHCKQLKYIVLLGDSVADYREARNYDSIPLPQVLIPIHWVRSPGTRWSGGYLDDNFYGSFSSAYVPDVAVGRIPATDNAQAFAYLQKLVEHEQLGKTRRDPALVLSSVEKSFQDLVAEVQRDHANDFTTVTALFPETSEATEDVHRLRKAIDSGLQLLYYVGHGGGFVWRVGPTDFKLQKDLFTPAEVRKLTNTEHYPVITCSSCYTTSFDLQESLGEALIFQPEGGSIAVVGTPWKSTVYEDHSFNKEFIAAYTRPQNKRLGDAFLTAKKKSEVTGAQPNVQAFIMLGDPCLKIVRLH